ncbi:hypothetical protein BG004_002591 [Podila humilis]|nr:hypothetical protein BG004_002591 [Podila humilis]
MSSQNVSDAVDNPENGVQRFQSQDKTRLQSLRGRYSSLVQEHYLTWDDIVTAFPDIDYLLVPTYQCVFLIDEDCELSTISKHGESLTTCSYDPLRIPVSSDDIATVVNRKVPHFKTRDNVDQELLLSDSCAHLLEPEEGTDPNPIMDALSALTADNSLVDLYIKLRMGMLTLKEFLEQVDEDDEERHLVLLWYFNLLQRHERLLASISLLENAGSSIKELQDDLADHRASLEILHKAILAFETASGVAAYQANRELEDESYPYYPSPYLFFLLPADVSTWVPNNPCTHTYRVHFLCNYEPDEDGSDTEGFHLLDHPGYEIRDWDGFLKIYGYYILTLMQSIQDEIELDSKEGEEGEEGKKVETIKDMYQSVVDGTPFSIQEFRELLDVAIKDLRMIVRVKVQLSMDTTTLRKVKIFLEGEDMSDSKSINKFVGLYPDWSKSIIDWRCPRHFVEKYKEVALDKLKSCAVSLDGDYDMALGVATIKVHSMDQVTEFLPSVQSLGLLSAHHQAAQFDMRDGAFQGLVDARFPTELHEQLLYALRRFVLETASHDPYYLSTLGNVLETNLKLTEVKIGAKESIILSQVVFCCRHLRNRAQSLHFTFYDDLSKDEERVVAELMLTSLDDEQDVASTRGSIDAGMEDLDRQGLDPFKVGSVDIKVHQWVMDTILEEMSDDEAAVLDMITAQVPDTLHSFQLNLQKMTRAGIMSL